MRKMKRLYAYGSAGKDNTLDACGMLEAESLEEASRRALRMGRLFGLEGLMVLENFSHEELENELERRDYHDWMRKNAWRFE